MTAGSAVTEVCRIRDSDAVRDALARSTGYLVVAVADGLYRDVLADGPYGLPRTMPPRLDFEPGDPTACNECAASIAIATAGAPGRVRRAGQAERLLMTWAHADGPTVHSVA